MANYLSLIVMNVFFLFVHRSEDASHFYDVVGLAALALAAFTFIGVHWRTGYWRLTHAKSDSLDERELFVTHIALSRSYGIFAVICLVIIFSHAVLDQFDFALNLVITIPLASSLLYLAHTLPGSILAWTEHKAPGDPE